MENEVDFSPSPHFLSVKTEKKGRKTRIRKEKRCHRTVTRCVLSCGHRGKSEKKKRNNDRENNHCFTWLSSDLANCSRYVIHAFKRRTCPKHVTQTIKRRVKVFTLLPRSSVINFFVCTRAREHGAATHLFVKLFGKSCVNLRN